MSATPYGHVIELAREFSTLSPCLSQRGAVLFDPNDGEVIGRGFNAVPGCDGSQACKATCRKYAVHAEQAAIINAGDDTGGMEMLHVKSVQGLVVPSPSGGTSCSECAKLMFHAGVRAIWLFHVAGWHRYPIGEYVAQSHETLASCICAGGSAGRVNLFGCPVHGAS